jgi:protein involved in sex pheromone biosynthesis
MNELQQILKAIQDEREHIKKIIRAEIEIEGKRISKDIFHAKMEILNRLRETKDQLKDVEIELMRTNKAPETATKK